MKENWLKSRVLALALAGLFSFMLLAEAMPRPDGAAIPAATEEEAQKLASSGSEPAAPSGQGQGAGEVEKGEPESTPSVVEREEQPRAIKKKKFPWLPVIAAAVVAGVVIYFLVIAKKKYELKTTVGAGVSGSPSTGTAKYKKGTVIHYSYAAESGFANLTVTLDGTPVAASGSFTMDRDRELSASATQMFTLTVTKKAGVNGAPETGTYSYARGTAVNYSYTAAAGFTGLSVKLDGVQAAASGTVTMDADHALTAEVADAYTLTVMRYDGVSGRPAAGTYLYKKGAVVNYSYALTGDYRTLKVRMDGQAVPASGSVTMSKDHVLEAWSWLSLWIKISADNQDACEDPAFHLSGILVAAAPDKVSGLVFPGVAIPKGAPIVSGSISVYQIGYPGVDTESVRATGFAEDNSPVFSADGTNKPSTRPLTSHSVLFIPNNQTHWQNSADIADIVAEIVTRPGWNKGNALGFKLSSDGGGMEMAGYSSIYDDNASLSVTYSTRIVPSPQGRLCRED